MNSYQTRSDEREKSDTEDRITILTLNPNAPSSDVIISTSIVASQRMKLFQVVNESSLWAVFAVSASDPNDREWVRYWSSDEQNAIDWAAALNRIAATHGGDETDLVDLTSELGVFDPPQRVVRFRD